MAASVSADARLTTAEPTVLERLIADFKRHRRLSGRYLAKTYGYGGWRTRVSEARRQFGLDIRCELQSVKVGKRHVLSSTYILEGR